MFSECFTLWFLFVFTESAVIMYKQHTLVR